MKIFCVGRNYAAHAKELGNEVPEDPVIFMKPKSALLQPHTSFYYPEFTNELHYECELVLRISKNGKYIQEKFAGKYYDAISAGIDFTARDIQKELKDIGRDPPSQVFIIIMLLHLSCFSRYEIHCVFSILVYFSLTL